MRRWGWLIMLWMAAGLSLAAGATENATEENAYYQAVQLFNHKNWDGARQAFNDFQRSYPRSEWRLAVQLRLADLETDPARAVKAYTEVVDAGGATEWGLDARWSLANTLYTLGKFTPAFAQFSTVAQSGDPRRARALYLAGRCQLALGNPKQAATLFTQVRDGYAQTEAAGLALAGLGDAAAARKDGASALEAYDQYLKDYPNGALAAQVAEQKAKWSPAAPSVEPAAAAPGEPTPAAAEPAATPGPGPAEEGFTIQVGAFTKPEYAQQLIRKLRKTGYNAYLLDGRSGSEIFHQVRVGNYSRRQFAEEIAAKLEKKEKLPTLILPYTPPGEKP